MSKVSQSVIGEYCPTCGHRSKSTGRCKIWKKPVTGLSYCATHTEYVKRLKAQSEELAPQQKNDIVKKATSKKTCTCSCDPKKGIVTLARKYLGDSERRVIFDRNLVIKIYKEKP
jgi:hypothetical protein